MVPPHPPSELCEGGNLMSSLAASTSYCERDVARIMRQLVDAVRHVHAQVGAWTALN
jgi:serine/threonine protein kinase